MIKQFQNPPAENRPRPFWFINGVIERTEVKKQIMEMKEKGLGGFFLCARQGMRVPYLSEDWFDICRYIVDLAKENGLEVWLYDEYPYPSGMSGGEVTIQHPETRQTELVLTDHTLQNRPLELSLGKIRLLSAMGYPVRNGQTIWNEGVNISGTVGILQNQQIYQHTSLPNSVHNRKRYFTYGPSKELRWSPPDGTWRVITAGEKEIEDFKYYGNFIDPANPVAVSTFIETTYTPYLQNLGDDFGAAVRGMFGDETGYLGKYPWSGQLLEYYNKRYGEGLEKNLAAILDGTYPNAAMIRYQYFQCLHELLRDRYHKCISEWCEKNHIEYVTEIPSLRMSNQRYSHVPGGDPNHDKLGFPLEKAVDRDFPNFRSNSKIISAIARQMGRRDCIVESFHSIGWSMTLQDAKWQIDRETLMGITLHNFHAFYYTVDGITKHDAPPSQFLQNPYWAYYKTLTDYCARSSRFVSETESSARVAVYHPITSWWTALANPMHRMHFVGGENSTQEADCLERLTQDYLELCKSLFLGNVDYDDLDAEIMALATIENGVIAIGRAKYDTLVVPPVKNMEGYAARMIERFVQSGGKLIICGLTPYEIIEPDFEPTEFFKRWGILSDKEYFNGSGTANFTEHNGVYFLKTPGGLSGSNAGPMIAEMVKKLSPQRVKVEIPKELAKQVVACRRENEQADYVFLSSQDGVAAVCGLETAPDKEFVEFDLETGDIWRLGATGRVEISLKPWQSRLIAAMDKTEAEIYPSIQKPLPAEHIVLPISEPWPVLITGENFLRLDDLEISVDGGDFVHTEPNMFVEQYRQTEQLKAKYLNFEGGFGLPLRPQIKYPIPVTYRLCFQVESIPSEIFILRDDMAIMGNFTVKVNGIPVEAFEHKFVYDQNNLVANLSAFVRKGENTVEIEGMVSEDWHGVSDPIYLMGDFGVLGRNGKFVIGDMPKTAVYDSRFVKGFPFYSGKMTYEIEMRLPKTDLVISLPDTSFHECIEIEVDGKPLGIRTFSPYEWILAADSRRPEISKVKMRIANTLINLFEGSYFDYENAVTTAITPDMA